MAMPNTRTPVEAPQNEPVPYGLFSAVPWRTTAERWVNGVTIRDNLGDGGTLQTVGALDCDNPNGATGLPLEFTQGLNGGDYDAFAVAGTFDCSPVGYTFEDAERLAAKQLQLFEEVTVEQRMWTLWTQTASTHPSPDAVPARTKVTVDQALGVLSHYVVRNYGGGVLHIPRWLEPLASDLTSRGERMFTRAGVPVVLGGGYGEPGEADQIIATPTLFGYRSGVQTVGEPEQVFDHGHNIMRALTQRDYLIGWNALDPVTMHVTDFTN